MSAHAIPAEAREEFNKLCDDVFRKEPRTGPERLIELAVQYPSLMKPASPQSAGFVFYAVMNKRFDILDTIAQHAELPLEATTQYGLTPLLHTLKHGYGDAAEKLLARGADATAATPQGQNAFHIAVRHSHNISLYTLLAGYGTDPDGKDANGISPLMAAKDHFRFSEVHKLIAAGADAFTFGGRLPAGASPQEVMDAAAASLEKGMGSVAAGIKPLDRAGLRDVFTHSMPAYTILHNAKQLSKDNFLQYGNGRLPPQHYTLISLGLFDRFFTAEKFGGIKNMLEAYHILPAIGKRAVDITDDMRDARLERPGSAVERYLSAKSDSVALAK